MTTRVSNTLQEVSAKPKWMPFFRSGLMLVENLYVVLIVAFLVARFVLRHVWWIALLNNFTPLYFLPLLVLLPLAVVTRNLAGTLRLLVVAAVGVIWFAPYFLPKSSAMTDAPLLRMATLNVDIDNPNVNLVRDWLRTTPLDGVFIQETPNSWRQNDITQQLTDVYPYTADTFHDRDEDGKIFLSRFPIVLSSEFKLTLLDRFFQQRLVLDTPLGRVVVYNIHLMPNFGDAPRLMVRPYNPLLNIVLSYDESFRQLQIDALLQQLDQETLPYIVAGDFNTSNFSTLYNELAGTLHDSFREAGVGFGMSWPATGVPPFLRIDYL